MGYGIKISENKIIENCIDLGNDPAPEGYIYSDYPLGVGLNYDDQLEYFLSKQNENTEVLEKLQASGLTVEELRTLLGLTP
jgi:hypothetical protein